MKILIVDDDAIVLESCRRVLEAEEIEVSAAENAHGAEEILKMDLRFDLIMTDIKMPGKDGFELLSLVRERFPGTAILMMTGYLIPETIQRGLQGGADGFIAKPFTPEELMASVHKTLLSMKGRK